MSRPYRGLYYRPRHDEIVYLYNVKYYEDSRSRFVICTYENRDKAFKRTMIDQKMFGEFKRIGNL